MNTTFKDCQYGLEKEINACISYITYFLTKCENKTYVFKERLSAVFPKSEELHSMRLDVNNDILITYTNDTEWEVCLNAIPSYMNFFLYTAVLYIVQYFIENENESK